MAVAAAQRLQPGDSVAWDERASPLVHASDRGAILRHRSTVGLLKSDRSGCGARVEGLPHAV